MMQAVLPWFNLGNAAVSVGLGPAAIDAAVGTPALTAGASRPSLAGLPTIRAQLAKMSIDLATTRTYLKATAGKRPNPMTTPCCTYWASRRRPTTRPYE